MDKFNPVSDKELKRGYWWLTHRQQARRVFVIFFIILVAVLYILLLINMYSLFTGSSWQKTASGLTPVFDWQTYHLERKPQNLQISSAQYFAVGGGRYNLVAFIQNPNPNWLVPAFEYNFVVNGQPLETQTGFLNPSDEKFLLTMGYNNTVGIKSLEVKLNNNISWQRLDDEVSHLDWEITNINFQPATTQEIDGERITLDPRLTWQAKNLSLYNFWNTTFQVALYNRDQLVAINSVKANDFNSLETRVMEAIWLNTLPRVTSYKVIPEVNWLDKDNFKQIETPVREGERFNL